MTTRRQELIRLNKQYIQLPMPNLYAMTDEKLEERANFFKRMWETWDDIGDDEDEEDL